MDKPMDNSGADQKSVTSKTWVSPPEHFKSEMKSLAQKMREKKQNDTTTTATEHYSTVLYCTFLLYFTALLSSSLHSTPAHRIS